MLTFAEQEPTNGTVIAVNMITTPGSVPESPKVTLHNAPNADDDNTTATEVSTTNITSPTEKGRHLVMFTGHRKYCIFLKEKKCRGVRGDFLFIPTCAIVWFTLLSVNQKKSGTCNGRCSTTAATQLAP